MATLKVDTITSETFPTVAITDGLVVSGVTTVTNTVNVDNGSGGMIQWGDIDGNGYGRLYADSTGTFIGSKSNDDLIFRTNHTEKVRLDTSGRLLIGHTASTGEDRYLQLVGTSGDTASMQIIRHSADASCSQIDFSKSRNATKGSNTVVNSGDHLGQICFRGDDGTDLNSMAASIIATVDGTPGSNDMPGRLSLQTTADGASTPTERLRITKTGRVKIGTGAIGITNSMIAQGGLQVSTNGASGAPTVCFGADGTAANTQTITDDTIKDCRIGFPNYDISEEPLALMCGFVGDGTDTDSSGSARLYIGGGTSWMNSVNNIRFYTAANLTTVTGTERARFDSGGRMLIGGTSGAGDGQLVVYSSSRLHTAIRCAGTSSNHGNGHNLLGDNYTATENQLNLGISYSGAGVVLSRNVKVSNAADDTYLSSQAQYSSRPSAFKLDDDGTFVFLNTATNATTAVDSAVTLSERLRVKTDGDVSIADGNLIVGTSGHGIDFHNYGSGTNINSNLLNDYEEGNLNWRLMKQGANDNGSNAGNTVMKYTKIGDTVYLSGWIRTDSTQSGQDGNAKVVDATTPANAATLPFTPNHTGVLYVGHTRTLDELGEAISIGFAKDSTTVFLYTNDQTGDYTPESNNVSTNTQTNIVITFQGSYKTDS